MKRMSYARQWQVSTAVLVFAIGLQLLAVMGLAFHW